MPVTRYWVTTDWSNIDWNIPQRDGSNSSDLKAGKSVITAVTVTPSDDNIATEKAVVDYVDTMVTEDVYLTADYIYTITSVSDLDTALLDAKKKRFFNTGANYYKVVFQFSDGTYNLWDYRFDWLYWDNTAFNFRWNVLNKNAVIITYSKIMVFWSFNPHFTYLNIRPDSGNIKFIFDTEKTWLVSNCTLDFVNIQSPYYTFFAIYSNVAFMDIECINANSTSSGNIICRVLEWWWHAILTWVFLWSCAYSFTVRSWGIVSTDNTAFSSIFSSATFFIRSPLYQRAWGMISLDNINAPKVTTTEMNNISTSFKSNWTVVFNETENVYYEWDWTNRRNFGVVWNKPVWTLQTTSVKGGVLRCIDDAVGDTAVTGNLFIEDEKYGWKVIRSATAVSVEFDSLVTRTWRLTLKLSNTDATGRCRAYYGSDAVTLESMNKYNIQLKWSTKYKLNCRCRTNNVPTNGAYIDYWVYSDVPASLATGTTNKLTGTNDWTLLTATFTTGATAKFLRFAMFNDVAGNVCDARFDVNSMTLEEVKEDTTSVSTPSIPDVIVQGVTTNDNIDNSLDTWGAYANTYALATTIAETATHRQTYTPTKKYTTRIGVWVVAKGTGNRTLTVHDASNVVIAQDTISNAGVTNGAFNYFSVRNIRSTGALHFHVTSSVADGTVKANTASDLETCSFIQNYAKKTESAKVVLNGAVTELKTDMDGISDGILLDYSKNKFFYENQFNTGVSFTNLYSATSWGVTTGVVVVNGWERSNTLESIQSASDTTARSFIAKVSIWNNLFDTCAVKPTLFNNNVLLGSTEISLDGSNRTTLWTLPASASAQTQLIDVSKIVKWKSFFFLRTSKDTTNGYIRKDNCQIAGTFIPQSPVWLAYPLSINQFTEEYKGSAVTRVYYRLNKFANRNGVVMPALEYTDWSANSLGFVMIPIDNSLETNPSVCLLSTSTGRQNSGTGANEAWTGYILNDGEYMTLSGTPSELKVDYRIGKGTTAFTDITKNSYYLSSNSQSSDATQDPSLQANVLLNVKNQWAQEWLVAVQRELNVIKSQPAYNVVRRTVWVGTTQITETYGASELIIAVPSTASAVGIDLSTKLLTDPTLKIITVVDESGACATNNITISTQRAELISGSATFVMNANYQSTSIYSNGTNRFIK